MPPDPLHELWTRLRAVTFFRYQARPGEASQTGWTGEARGTVELAPGAGDAVLDFVERGTFTFGTAAAKTITIHNRYRWELGPGQVRVSHLRFSRPVWLVDLVAAGPGRFRSTRPHRCGDDRYSLALALHEERIDAHWTIRGPRKDEHLHYAYGARPFP